MPSVYGRQVSSPNGLITITIITKLPDVQRCAFSCAVVTNFRVVLCLEQNKWAKGMSIISHTTTKTSPSVFKVSTAMLSLWGGDVYTRVSLQQSVNCCN